MNPRILTLVTPGTLGTKTLRAEWIIWLRTGAWELARSGLQSQFYNCGGHMSCSPWEHFGSSLQCKVFFYIEFLFLAVEGPTCRTASVNQRGCGGQFGGGCGVR